MNIELTQSRLKELIHYDPDSGVCRWIVNKARAKAGSLAGGLARGYLRVHVDGRDYFVHRLAWLYVHGHMPPEFIDHVNHDKGDNRINNLRLASKAENAQNLSTLTGMTGVTKAIGCRGRWVARIRIDGRKVHLGMFSTPGEAHQKYLEAKRQHHPFNMI